MSKRRGVIRAITVEHAIVSLLAIEAAILTVTLGVGWLVGWR